MQSVYLAGPCGFSEIGSHGLQSLEQILNTKFSVLNPFKEGETLGKEIVSLQQKLHNSSSNASFVEIKTRLQQINQDLGKNNAGYIQDSDLIIAVLDGSDVDSGTAAEIGYAYGIGKKIYGYRGDFRNCGDNLGSVINLQVEYFINASGGQIFYSLDELKLFFASC
ncbi:nucleoside 2-deoxyribosyltransferase [Candidatus Lokiarchaeum ossiferum]|uniref:nucleoside 2-deoxyribosyltransferase n=1 Tax=Candidatus Lokiarchaeum ossiferum TaxID=2951803 RepID=UPI00352D743F